MKLIKIVDDVPRISKFGVYDEYECQLCGKKCKKKNSLSKHLSTIHGLNNNDKRKDYYDKYLKVDGEGICVISGKPTKFINFSGYNKYINTPEVNKIKLNTKGITYLMKVKKLSYDDALIERQNIVKRNSEGVKKAFSEKIKKDPLCWNKSSIYCKEYWINKGYSKEDSIQLANDKITKNREKLQKILKDDPSYMKNKLNTSLDYWLKKTNGNEEEAKKLLSERQTTFNLEKCIEKYGEDDGRKRWVERQEKWCKNYKKSNYSKISQELFWSIYDKLEVSYKNNKSIYFAELLNNRKDESEKNNEYRLKLKNRVIIPDFFILENKKIIEFDGVYWHNEHKIKYPNQNRDNEKSNDLINEGYSILRIVEDLYYKNKEEIVKQCLEFIYKDL